MRLQAHSARPTRARRGRRHRRSASRTGTVVLAACGLLLVGCGRTDTESVSATQATDRVAYDGAASTVTVGVLRQPHLSHALFYDAFLPEGVELETVPFANSTEIKNAVVSGDLDFGVTGITSALQGAAADEPVVVVAAAADGGSAIVAGADSGITEVADLSGAKIGFVPGSAQDVLLRLTLRDNGLDAETDVELVNVQFADMAAALARGDIDAFSGAETGPSEALVNSDATLVVHPYDTDMGKINIAFVTNEALIAQDPALVEAMVGVHAAATDYMVANTGEWVQAVVDQYGYTEDSLAMAVENIDLRWDLDEAYVEQVQVLGEQQFSLGVIDAEPDYDAFVDPSFVEAVGG